MRRNPKPRKTMVRANPMTAAEVTVSAHDGLMAPSLSSTDDRLEMLTTCTQNILGYHEALLEARRSQAAKSRDLESTRRYGCPRITELAIRAEKSSRILMKISLDSLNGLRDCGSIGHLLSDSGTIPPQGLKTKDLVTAFKSIEHCLPGNFPRQAWSGYLSQQFAPYQGSLRVASGKMTVQFRNSTGKDVESVFPIEPQSGCFGRVTSADLFGGAEQRLTLRNPGGYAGRWSRPRVEKTQVSLVNSAHSREADFKTFQKVDLYTLFVRNFIAARDAMYVHVRDVQGLGIGGMQGNDVVTVLVLLGIIAEGFAIWYADDCLRNNRKSDTCTAAEVFAAIGTFGLIFTADSSGGDPTISPTTSNQFMQIGVD